MQQWFDSEDAAVEALESATEYLWGLDWDIDMLDGQVHQRINELNEGIALDPRNPYFIPEEPESADCGCKEPGDICSEGEYVGRCECEAFELCDVCVAEYEVDHTEECDCPGYDLHDCMCPCHSKPMEDEEGPEDGFPDYVMTELGRLEEKIDKLAETLRPKQWITPQFGMGGGISSTQPHQAYNTTPMPICNCYSCVSRRKQQGSQT